MLVSTSKLSTGKSHEEYVPSTLPPFPFPVLQKYASQTAFTNPFLGVSTLLECTGSKQGECATNKNTKALASGNGGVA